MYWIIDNRADIVAMLMDPISYATQVLKEMDEDLVSLLSQQCFHNL